MSYDNRGWSPAGQNGRGRGEMRAASNIDTYANAPATLEAARGLFQGRFSRSPTRTESTGNVAKEQATTPEVSNEVWARAVPATQPSSPPTDNIGEQTRDESSLFSSAGPVVVAIPAAVDRPLQSAIPTSSTAPPLPSISNGDSNSLHGHKSKVKESALMHMYPGIAPELLSKPCAKKIAPSPGTMDFTFVPFKEPDPSRPRTTQEYETITIEPPLSNYSLEELRLADYNKLANTQLVKPAVTSSPSVQPVSSTPQASMLVKRLAGRSRLQLLKGPGIEVVVGARPDLTGIDASAETWCLSKALISHYSSTLKDACNRGHDDSHNLRIILFSEDPAIFELFVEWINNGTYTLEAPLPATTQPGVNIDAQAWVLGDRLGSIQFKNYAMGRLYARYTSAFEPHSIVTADVNYSYEQTAHDSRLRMLFNNLLAVNFLDCERTVGSTAEWDGVLQKHPQLRVSLLGRLRVGSHILGRIRDLEKYMETEEAQPSPAAQLPSSSMVIPAKRNADGVPVKKEPTDA
ncbi:hypothetical protein HBI67_064750 [Parastagonospora nodorum]|nr:hypothetical protein HBI79_048380 [Parastagonospora nodorum]KAH6074271.1 hypothetical protein HBI67_064750 [Parastagonospora nodorum]KAH6088215.1 hypothetical protein HBI66_032620 [Parastagonospora nodorum]